MNKTMVSSDRPGCNIRRRRRRRRRNFSCLHVQLAANLIGFLLFLWNAHMDTLERRLAALDACARPDPADHAQLLLAFDQSILVLKGRCSRPVRCLLVVFLLCHFLISCPKKIELSDRQCLSVRPPVSPSVRQSVSPSVTPSVHPSSIRLMTICGQTAVRPSVRPSVRLMTGQTTVRPSI